MSADIIADTTRRIFREQGDPRTLRTRNDAERLWGALETAGLTRGWVCEALNGSGASLYDGFEILRVSGEFAVCVPLGETLLAGWLLQRANIPVPNGVMTVAPADVRDHLTLSAAGTVSGKARSIPFARIAGQMAVLASRDQTSWAALVDRGRCQIQEHTNLAQDARDIVTFNAAAVQAPRLAAVDVDALMLMGAAVRSMQMAGALQGVLDLSVSYANERVAFERPIAKFQAIQHSLAKLAGETAAALAAAGSAADAIGSATSFDGAVFLEVASAKIRVGEAVEAGAAIAHQVHGAIGFSQEHVLHRYTHRMWAWRDDFGSESYWAVKLGQFVARRGADALWPMLAAR